MANSYLAADLFSGCGGMTQGLKDGGFDVLFAVEIDPVAVETYKSNHKEVVVYDTDIKAATGTKIRSDFKLEKGELDLLAGCPPCQGFSTIRNLNGSLKIDDPRNSLIAEFFRLTDDLRPKTVMLENVPGLQEAELFAEFCSNLESIGYCVSHRILDAADYSVPQRRKRLILLAGNRGPVDFAEPSIIRKTVRDAIESLPKAGESGDPLHDISENRSERILSLIRKIPKDGGSRSALGEEDQLECHKKTDGFKDVYGRMIWDDVAPTLTGGCVNPSKGRFLHPEQNRAITLREAALLQSFPEDYRISLTRGKYIAADLIGNALPPEFIQHHAEALREYISHLMKQPDRVGEIHEHT